MAIQLKTGIGRLVTAAALLVIVTGCETVQRCSLTGRVWDNDEWSKFSKPAPNPRLALFDASDRADVLVQYDALSEKRSAIRRQAYFLHQSQARVDAGKKPRLVKLSAADGLKSLPVLAARNAGTVPPPAYAILTKEGGGFTLYRSGQLEEAFALPIYSEASGTATRLALTPLAAAGDTVMVAAVAGVIGFVIWVQSGAPTY